MVTETHTLFVNEGGGTFHDDGTLASGLAMATAPRAPGFGTLWLDFDNDGWLDLFTADGEVKVIAALERSGDRYPLHQTNQLLHNRGDGTLEDVSTARARRSPRARVGRGAAFGDVDNDGDTDIVVGNASGPVKVLLNRVQNDNHWLGLRLVGPEENIPRTRYGWRPRGASVRAGAATLVRRARADGSYASANDPRVLVGLGARRRRRSSASGGPAVARKSGPASPSIDGRR